MSSDKKEEEIYGENAVVDSMTMENLEPFIHSGFEPKSHQLQNPLGDMIKGLTSMVTGRTMSQKLTLSGPIGEGQISMEITDSFTASMAHDIINKVIDEKRGKQKEEVEQQSPTKGVSEEEMFRHLSRNNNKKMTD